MTTHNTLDAEFARRLVRTLKASQEAIAHGNSGPWSGPTLADETGSIPIGAGHTWAAPWSASKSLFAVRATPDVIKSAVPLALYLTCVDPTFVRTLCNEIIRADKEIGELTDAVNKLTDLLAQTCAAHKQTVEELHARIETLAPDADDIDDDNPPVPKATIPDKLALGPMNIAMTLITSDNAAGVPADQCSLIHRTILAAIRNYDSQRFP